jgi:hypothetical protein
VRAASCADVRMPGFDPLEGMGCEFLKPKVMPGGPCRQSYECVNGYCAGADMNRDGVCAAPRKANGMACMDDDECVSSNCVNARCAPPMPGAFCQG